MKMWRKFLSVCLVLLLAFASTAGATSGLSEEQIEAIREEISEKRSQIETLEKDIEALEAQIQAVAPPETSLPPRPDAVRMDELTSYSDDYLKKELPARVKLFKDSASFVYEAVDFDLYGSIMHRLNAEPSREEDEILGEIVALSNVDSADLTAYIRATMSARYDDAEASPTTPQILRYTRDFLAEHTGKEVEVPDKKSDWIITQSADYVAAKAKVKLDGKASEVDISYRFNYELTEFMVEKLYIDGEISFPAAEPVEYEKLDYKGVSRNPDDYMYALITFTGTVIQVMEGDESTQYRIATDGKYDDVVYVEYIRPAGSPRVLEDDKVTVNGICFGVVSYKSTLGGSITVPACYATEIVIDD